MSKKNTASGDNDRSGDDELRQRLENASWSREPDRSAAHRAAALAEQAARCMASWDAEGCIQAYERAIHLAPNVADHHLGLAAAHMRFGDQAAALSQLQAFLELEPAASPTARRLKRLLEEQTAQAQIRQIRQQLAQEERAIATQRDQVEAAVAAELASRVEKARQAAQQLVHWMRDHLGDMLDEPVRYEPSHVEVVAAGETLSESHVDALAQVVQRHAQALEDWAQAARQRRLQALDAAQDKTAKAAERAIVRVHEQHKAVADEVEILFAQRMREDGLSNAEIETARAMWIEYRLSIGRQSIPLQNPATWAAGIDYTLRRVGFLKGGADHVAELYGVSQTAVRARHQALVDLLDIMPCDYRYFTGKENPLDRLVEAAVMLEELERRFRDPTDSA